MEEKRHLGSAAPDRCEAAVAGQCCRACCSCFILHLLHFSPTHFGQLLPQAERADAEVVTCKLKLKTRKVSSPLREPSANEHACIICMFLRIHDRFLLPSKFFLSRSTSSG